MELILFYCLAFLAEVVGTLGGFGSSIFLIPIAGLFFDFHSVLAVTGVLHVFSNLIKIKLFKEGIDFKLLMLVGLPSVIFVFIGSVLTNYVNLIYAEITLGIFLVIFSTIFIVKPNLSVKPTNSNAVIGGSTAGFLAGLIGTGGAIRGLSLAAFNLEKNAFISTSAAIDLGVDFTRTSVYLFNGYLEAKFYFMVPILLLIAFLGSYVGKLILKRISQEYFKKIVLGFIFCIGIFMIINYLR